MNTLNVFFILVSFPLLTLVVNRALLLIFPWRRDHPAQGTVTLAALLSLFLELVCFALLFEGTLTECFWWMVYAALLLGCSSLVWISLMCVSESGRRFYLLHLIDSGVKDLEELRQLYGRQHMMQLRLERLLKWGVIEQSGERYRLLRWSAYWYSLFFHLWGRFLGFQWR